MKEERRLGFICRAGNFISPWPDGVGPGEQERRVSSVWVGPAVGLAAMMATWAALARSLRREGINAPAETEKGELA